MKGIKSLDWHFKRAKFFFTATRLYPKPIKWRSMCAQWPWDWLDLHLRVDRNGLQMNEIRSMCSGDTVTFDRKNENKSFKFHLKPWYLKRIEFVFLLVKRKNVKALGTFFTASRSSLVPYFLVHVPSPVSSLLPLLLSLLSHLFPLFLPILEGSLCWRWLGSFCSLGWGLGDPFSFH